MVDFRTRPPGGKDKGGSGDWLEKAFRQAYSNIENDPEAQARLALSLQDQYGLGLELLAPALPKLGEGIQQLEAQQQNQEGPPPGAKVPNDGGPMDLNDMSQETPETPDVEPTPEAVKPSPDQLIGFLEEVMSYVGEDFTLGELRDWAEENPDLVNTAIELKF